MSSVGVDMVDEKRTLRGPAGKVELTQREHSLFCCLADHAGNVVTRRELLESAWGWSNAADVRTKTVDVHVGRLRTKLARAGYGPEVLQTVRGLGYKLEIPR